MLKLCIFVSLLLTSSGVKIPPEWVVYIQDLLLQENVRVNEIILPPRVDGTCIQSGSIYKICLPTVLIWHPLQLLQQLLNKQVWECCPIDQCTSHLTVSRWNTGRVDGHSPRLVHDISNIVLLVPAIYVCGNGHEILATDPRILLLFPEEEYIPFILFYRSGVMRTFARMVISLCIDGLSFSMIENFIQAQRQQNMGSLQLQVISLLGLHNIQIFSPQDLATILDLQKPYPSNDLLCKSFLASFAENRLVYFTQMSSLSTTIYISIDHTFKVTANLGYLRADGKWVTQYNSLFIVLNNQGQVIAWQFTRTTSIDECEVLLVALKDRCIRLGQPVLEVYVDNCCQSRNKLQSIFGEHVCVYLDIFHAAQRITKTISKRHPLCQSVMSDIKLLFRDPSDIGKVRTLPTPDKATLLKKIDDFVSKWKDVSSQDWHVINEKTVQELASIKGHVEKGCLSGIKPSCGTNKNENLHKNINPFFSRCRMGIPLALALLSILFHHHNLKISKCDGCLSSILSAKAKYKIPPLCTTTCTEEFGIVSKKDITDNDSWIFSSQVIMPEHISNDVIEMDIAEDLADVCTVDDLGCLLQSSVNLYQLTKNLNSQSNYTPMMNQAIIPFMSSITCLFDAVGTGELDDHERRLRTLVQSWGFKIHSIVGDGNCFFSAVATSLLHQQLHLEEKYPVLVMKFQLNIATTENIALQLRHEAVEEWMNNTSEYQEFIPSEYNVETEAPKFKDTSYFFGPLANTMVKAISNSLGIPIIVFSSALHYPVVYTTPRVVQGSIPLYIAYNQAGPGHYSALSFQCNEQEKHARIDSDQVSSHSRCTCGHKDKNLMSTTKRCIPLQKKYTSVIRCSCLAGNKSCNVSCLCFNCNNPNGVRPNKGSRHIKTRVRQKHAWQHSYVKSSLYAHHLDELVTKGPHTPLEYLLLSQIIAFLFRSSGQKEPDTTSVSLVYDCCVQLALKHHMYTLPLGQKTNEEINDMIQKHLKNLAVFKALCEAHLTI